MFELEDMDVIRRNRARYRETAMALATLRSERLAGAQAAARHPAPATGADEAHLFARQVREFLGIEHAEWKAVLENNTRHISEIARRPSDHS